MKLLVTGGAGFIGSHLADWLLSRGDEVLCLDNFDDYYAPEIKRSNIAGALLRRKYRLIEGDIRDPDAVEACFRAMHPDCVVHLAARAGVRVSLMQPDAYYDVNVIGTLRLLEAMRRHGVTRMVFASSSSVYGNGAPPHAETDRVDMPISPYAATKKAGELLCYTYSHLYAFDIFCLRFFTVYGPRQRPDMAIHRFIGSILAEEPMTLYGDGSSCRDYTYIGDILDGLLKSIDLLQGFEILNLGESRMVSLHDLIRVIEHLAGKEAIVRWEPLPPGDVTATCADISKARRILGYNPAVTIERGLEEFVRWYQQQQKQQQRRRDRQQHLDAPAGRGEAGPGSVEDTALPPATPVSAAKRAEHTGGGNG